MDNGEKKISSLFDGRTIFKIPEYQRAYAWEECHLSDFIEDIENQKPDRSYFLGTVLFEEKGLDRNYEIIDIVDGQQRLTTIIIFMYALIECLRENASGEDEQENIELLYETYVKHKRRFKLKALAEDNDFFQSYILSNKDGKDYIRTPAQRRLYKAKYFFTKRLAKKNKSDLNTLRKKIDENSRVLVYSVKDTAEATLIFETTNDRGKGLTNLEKIKSFMMYKSYVASNDMPDQLLDTIRLRFSKIYEEYERYEDKLDEDSILQYHFIAHNAWNAKEFQQYVGNVKEKVNYLIAKGKDRSALEFIEKYTKELKETFFTVHEILLSNNAYLRSVFILGRTGNFWPLLIKAHKLDETKGKKKFSAIARFLEIYSFRVYAVNQNRGNTGQSKLYAYARDFSGDFERLELQLTEIISRYSTDKLFRSNLSDSYIYQWMNSRDLSYFFWQYENHLRSHKQPKAAPMSESEFVTKSSKFKLSIEHIASQMPLDSIIKDKRIIPDISEEFQELYLHSLGNLTIDPQSSNSSKSNIGFSDKNEKYFRKAPFKTQNELEDFVIEDLWGEDAINKRKRTLIKFALKYWSISST